MRLPRKLSFCKRNKHRLKGHSRSPSSPFMLFISLTLFLKFLNTKNEHYLKVVSLFLQSSLSFSLLPVFLNKTNLQSIQQNKTTCLDLRQALFETLNKNEQNEQHKWTSNPREQSRNQRSKLPQLPSLTWSTWMKIGEEKEKTGPWQKTRISGERERWNRIRVRRLSLPPFLTTCLFSSSIF